jgi:hypothetical protein
MSSRLPRIIGGRRKKLRTSDDSTGIFMPVEMMNRETHHDELFLIIAHLDAVSHDKPRDDQPRRASHHVNLFVRKPYSERHSLQICG